MMTETKTSNPDEIFVTLEDSDFKRKDEYGAYIWREFIEAIKEAFPYPEGKYNGELKSWIIKDSDSNRQMIKNLEKLYFGTGNG